MPTYKLQVQDDDAHSEVWRDVKDAAGAPLLFQDEAAARSALEQQFPLLVKLEKFAAGPKRARVVVADAYADIDKEKDA
jgi:hypothetical protein